MKPAGFVLLIVTAIVSLGQASAQDAPLPANQQQPQSLDNAQLDQLVAPIALYSDPLLAQVLMASTYPLEVVQADRWAKANKSLKGDKLTAALEKQDWDASVKQLVSTPTVLAMMNDKLDWTQALGDAVLAQQADVMDAIQRLRAKAQANGKLDTTKQQKVTVKQDQGSAPIIEIEPASPDVVYVPYYEPAVVYGDWPYPAYPPYYFPPPAGWVVGGAIATGIAWGAAYAIGREIWDDFDWRHGNIDIDIDRNVNIDANRNFNKWEHNSYHRRGVAYNNVDVKNKFNKANINANDRKLDYRGRSGEQVLKPGNKPGGGELKPGGDNRPDLGGKGERPGGRPDIGQIEKGLKDRPGKPANLTAQKPDLGKAKPKGKGPAGGNAFDLGDGPKAKDFAKRGQASLGNRGQADFKRPSGGGSSRSKVAAARAWKAVRGAAGTSPAAVEVAAAAGTSPAAVEVAAAAAAAAVAAAAGGVPTPASSKTLPRWCGLATVSSSIASATRAAIAPSMSASWRRNYRRSTPVPSLMIATDICWSTTTGSG